MCGIVGYIGDKSALAPVIDGLQALEYRGYDSAGITAISNGKPHTVKEVGRVENLSKLVKGKKVFEDADIAIGHTRWATHGSPTRDNAHPQFNDAKTIFVVHNGIIENYQQIKQKLQKAGYKFVSETDTEVIPQLIDYNLKSQKDFYKAFKATLKQLQGAYAIAALYAEDPGTLYAARLSSPLVIGIGKDCHYIASDPTALMERTKKIIFLKDYEVARLTKQSVKIHNIEKEVQVIRQAEELDFDVQQAHLSGFAHFMLKEIHEAPQTIQSATRGRVRAHSNTIKLGGLENVSEQLKYIDRIVIVACGTASYAGMLGEYFIEELAGIPVEVQLGSEFKYRSEPFSRGTALIVVSQSGETADTIAALKKVENFGVLRLGVVNATGSTMTRMTDAGVYCHAGPEQAVASTKAFIAQVTVLLLIALYLSDGRSKLYKPLLAELNALPAKAEDVLKQAGTIKKLAEKYSSYNDFLYIGRRYGFPTALEGSLKHKECALVHAEGYAAGEMKHGPLALIDNQFPTFAIATNSSLLEKTYSNIEEIRTRKGPVIAVATNGNKAIKKLADDVIYIPNTMEQTSPLLVAIVMQLFSYYTAVHKNLNVDRPRNLAKSVTVE